MYVDSLCWLVQWNSESASNFPFANSNWAQTNLSATGASATVAFTAGSIGNKLGLTGTNSISVTYTNGAQQVVNNTQPTIILNCALFAGA